MEYNGRKIEDCRLNYWVSKLHLRWNIMERRLKIASWTTGYLNETIQKIKIVNWTCYLVRKTGPRGGWRHQSWLETLLQPVICNWDLRYWHWSMTTDQSWYLSQPAMAKEIKGTFHSKVGMAKNQGEPQKMTHCSETEIFFRVVWMGKL